MPSTLAESRRFSIRPLRPLWIGLATVVLVVSAVNADDPWQEAARWKRNSSSPLMIAVSRGGKIVATGDEGGRIVLWDASKKVVTETFTDTFADTLQFSPDGTILATTSGRSLGLSQMILGGNVRFWSTETGEMLDDFEFGLGVNAAVFMPDGKKCVVAEPYEIHVLDLKSHSRVSTSSEGNSGLPNSAVYAVHTGDEFASVSGDDIHFWNLEPLKKKRVMYSGRLWSTVAVALDAKQYATCTTFRTEDASRTVVETWDIKENRRHNRSEIAGSHRKIQYSPDGTLICAFGDSREVHLWNARKLDYMGKIDGASGPVDFSVDGSFLVSGTDNGDVGVWRVGAQAKE